MTHFAILDTNAGLLQWIGIASEEGEAFDKYCDELGVTDHVEQDEMLDTVKIYKLSAAEARRVKSWWESGASSNETPDCIRWGGNHDL